MVWFIVEAPTLKDLELAKQRLKDNNLSLAIVKNGIVVFETKAHGVQGFLSAIETLRGRLRGSSVADRIVGRAAAMLCLYAEVKDVFAVVMSEKAMRLLKDKSVYCESESLVLHVLDKSGRDMCPFERLVAEINAPAEAYARLKACAVRNRD